MSKHAIHIQEFGNTLQNFIDREHPLEQFGMAPGEDREVDKILSDVLLVTSITAALAREVEYFMQGAISKTTFLSRYKKIELEYEAILARLTG